MANFFRGPSKGGFKKRDGKPSFNRGGSWGGNDRGDSNERSLHKAECAACGNVCEVPFKPNGRKPVYCSDCFRKDEGALEQPRYAAKPSYGEKRAFGASSAGCACKGTGAQLDMINEKLDAILGMLQSHGE